MSKRTRIPAAPRSAMPEPITGPPAPSYSASQERGPTLKKAHTTAEQRAQVEHLQRTPLSDNLIDSFLRENPTNVTRFTLRAFHCDQHNTPPHRPYWPNDHYGLGPRALELHIKLWKRRPKIILHNNRPHSAPSISSTSTTAQQPNSAHSPEQSSTATAADQLGSIDIVQNWVQVAVAYAWLKDRRKKGRELGAKGIPPWSITPRPRNLGIARLLDLHKLTRKAVVEIVRKDVWADETNGCQTLVKFALSHKSCSYFCGIDTIHGPGGLNVWSTLYLDPKTPDPTPEKAQSSSSNQNRQASQAASGQAGPKTVKVLVRKGRKRSLFSRGSLRDYLTAQTDKFQQSASGGGSRSSEAIPEPDFEIIEEEDEDEMEESDEEREDDDDEEEDEDDGVRRPGQRSQGSSQPGSQRDRSRSNTGKGRRRPKMPPPDRIMLALKSKSDAHDLQEILKPFLHVHFLAEYRQIERAFDAELDRLREASVDVESYIRQAVKLDEASPGLEAQKLINLLPKNLSLPSAGSDAKTQPLEVAHDSDGDIVCLPDNPSAERERKRRIQKRKDDRAAARARGQRASDEDEEREGEEDEIYCSSDTDPIGRSLEHTAQKNRQKRSSNQGGASHSLETYSQSRSSSPTARFNTASQGQLLGNGEEKGKKRQHRNVLAQMTTQLVQSGRLSGHADYHGDDSGGARSEAGPSSRPIHRIRSILEDDDYDEVENVRPAHRVVPSQASSRSQHGSSPLAQQQLQQSQPIRRQYEGRAGQIAIPAFLQSELAKAHGGGLRSVTYNFGDMDLDQLDDAVESEHVSDGGEYEEDDQRLEGSESDDDGDDNDFARVERAGKKRVRGRRRKKNGKAARGGGGSANVRNRAPARDEDGFERLSDEVDSADEAVRQVQEFMERERREQAEAEAKANAKAAEEAAGKKVVAQKEQALGAVESGSFYGAKAAHGGGAARMAPKSTATAAAAGASLSNGHAGSAESSALTNGTGPDAEDKENRRPAAAARTTMVVDDDGHMVVAGGDVGAAAAVMKDAHWIASTLVTPQAASLPVLAASTAHSSPAAKTPRIGAGAGRKRKRPEVDAVRPASEGNESRGEETPSLLLLPHHADNPEREGGVNGRARRSNAGVPSAALRADYQLSSPKLTKSSGSRGEAVKTSPYFQANDAASTGNHAATTHDEEDDDAVLVILPPGSDSSVRPAFHQRSNGPVPNGMLASTSPHQSSRAAAADPVPASPAKGTPRAADTEETRDAGDDSDELQELMAQQR